jgi:hypothetical protein
MLSDSDPTSDLSKRKSRQQSALNNERSHFRSIDELAKAESRTQKQSNEKPSTNPALDESAKLSTLGLHQIIVKPGNELSKTWDRNWKTQ